MSHSSSVQMIKIPPPQVLWDDGMSSKVSLGPNQAHRHGGGAVNKPSPLRANGRVYNTLNFITNEGQWPVTPMSMVESMSSEEQELLLTQELLYVLSGTESCLITVHNISSNRIGFVVCRINCKLVFVG